MATRRTTHNTMRIYHRYLGFFLAGIMAVYAVSGIVMIFRNTDFLKIEKHAEQKLAPGLDEEAVGRALRIRDLKFQTEVGEIALFKQGSYNKSTGIASYTIKSLPYLLDKLSKFHKSNTTQPLFYLNVFFGVALLFFVLSSFWMFLPGTTVFRKGLYFSIAGLVLTLLLLFV